MTSPTASVALVPLQTQRVYRLERPARRRHPLRRLHRLWRRYRGQ